MSEEPRNRVAADSNNPLQSAFTVLRANLGKAGSYLMAASLLIVSLTIIGKTIPFLPTFAIPFAMLFYAVPATFGATYGLVVKRYFTQNRYAPEGALAQRRGRWLIPMAVFFVFSLASACLFLMEAPGWKAEGWILVYGAIVFYFAIYQFVYRHLLNQYDARYCKSISMTLSAAVTAIALCFVSVVLLDPEGLQGRFESFEQAQENWPRYFANSPCLLLCEVEKISASTDVFMFYGLEDIAKASIWMAHLIRIIASFSVFYGLANLLSCCMLTADEIKSGFKPLPAFGEQADGLGIRRNYIFWLVALWALMSLGLVAADSWLKASTEGGQSSPADTAIEKVNDWFGFVPLLELTAEEQALYSEYTRTCDNIASEHEEELVLLINQYYDSCTNNVDSYLDWHEESSDGLLMGFELFSDWNTSHQFRANVIKPVDSTDLDEALAAYEAALLQAWDSYQMNREAQCLADPERGVQLSLNPPAAPALWPDWGDAEGECIVRDVLLGSQQDATREEMKAEILTFIESRREAALAKVHDPVDLIG